MKEWQPICPSLPLFYKLVNVTSIHLLPHPRNLVITPVCFLSILAHHPPPGIIASPTKIAHSWYQFPQQQKPFKLLVTIYKLN